MVRLVLWKLGMNAARERMRGLNYDTITYFTSERLAYSRVEYSTESSESTNHGRADVSTLNSAQSECDSKKTLTHRVQYFDINMGIIIWRFISFSLLSSSSFIQSSQESTGMIMLWSLSTKLFLNGASLLAKVFFYIEEDLVHPQTTGLLPHRSKA